MADKDTGALVAAVVESVLETSSHRAGDYAIIIRAALPWGETVTYTWDWFMKADGHTDREQDATLTA